MSLNRARQGQCGFILEVWSTCAYELVAVPLITRPHLTASVQTSVYGLQYVLLRMPNVKGPLKYVFINVLIMIEFKALILILSFMKLMSCEFISTNFNLYLPSWNTPFFPQCCSPLRELNLIFKWFLNYVVYVLCL